MEHSLSRRSFNGLTFPEFQNLTLIRRVCSHDKRSEKSHELLNSEVARRSDEQLRVHEGAALWGESGAFLAHCT
jgi:hypothetical protein